MGGTRVKAAYPIGAVVSEVAYSSTSVDQAVAKQFAKNQLTAKPTEHFSR